VGSLAELLVYVPVLNERIHLGGLGYIGIVISDADKIGSPRSSIETVGGSEEMALGNHHCSAPMAGDTATSTDSQGGLPGMTTSLSHISPYHALLSMGILIGQVVLKDSAATGSMEGLTRSLPQAYLRIASGCGFLCKRPSTFQLALGKSLTAWWWPSRTTQRHIFGMVAVTFTPVPVVTQINGGLVSETHHLI